MVDSIILDLYEVDSDILNSLQISTKKNIYNLKPIILEAKENLISLLNTL